MEEESTSKRPKMKTIVLATMNSRPQGSETPFDNQILDALESQNVISIRREEQLHHRAGAASSRLARVLRLLDLGDHELERLGDVLVVSGASLGPRASELRPELLSLVHRHLSLFGP